MVKKPPKATRYGFRNLFNSLQQSNGMANCPLCNSKENTLLFRTKDKDPRDIIVKEIFNLVRCVDCSMVFVENMPSKKDISKYYGSGYYAQKNISNNVMNKIIMASRLSKIPKKNIRSILDYGCGNGDFLLKMKQNGLDVSGVEFSEDGRNICSKKLDAKIFDENKFYKLKDKFDVITLWHVLEHIYEPSEVLTKIREVLKEDGTLIISVPNIDSLQFKIFGRNTFHLDIPRHFVHYSPKTIRMLLEKNRFNVVGFNYYSIEYNPFGFIQSLLNSIGCEFNFLYNIIKRGYTRRVSISKFIYSFLAAFILLPFLILIAIPWTYFESMLGYGASFVVYARK